MVFHRKIYQKLLEWKEKKGRTGLLLEGARRVGKSAIAENFGRNEYRFHILIDLSTCSQTVKDAFLYEIPHLSKILPDIFH